LAFGRISPDNGRALERIREVYPKAIVLGCTTNGEIRGTRLFDDTVCATAVAFEYTSVVARSVDLTPDTSYAAGASLARSFPADGLRHVFLLSEGLRVNASDLVDGLGSALPPGVSVSGGMAADGSRLSNTYVWCNGEPREQSVAALGFYGDRLRIGVAASGLSWPFGPERIVTKSEKNVLYELDGRSALGIIKDYLGEFAAGLPGTGLMFPLQVKLHPSGHKVVRALLGVNEEEQSICYSGNIPEGSSARLMMDSIEEMIEGSYAMAQASLAGLNGVCPQLSVIVSCSARRLVFKQRCEEELEAVREVLGNRPVFAGFYSQGEVAPVESGTEPELHHETISMTNFAEV
jgi:hypothetical protein